VGLNVEADNQIAIACYEKLGFERVTSYGEYTVASNT
jgi:ribosomal protein S18 acetylase RimI-like enzyme